MAADQTPVSISFTSTSHEVGLGCPEASWEVRSRGWRVRDGRGICVVLWNIVPITSTQVVNKSLTGRSPMGLPYLRSVRDTAELPLPFLSLFRVNRGGSSGELYFGTVGVCIG